MTTEVLFTRQRHEAFRAGLHFDYRIVLGDKAYSWATKKDMPEPGHAIILHEQPVHDRQYALSEKVVIPKGEYGGGTTTLDFARKATADIKPGKYVITTTAGERFLILHMPSYGPKQWLFTNITGKGIDKAAAVVKPKPKSKSKTQQDEGPELSQEQQTRVLEKLKARHPRLVAFHGLGSGKTMTGIRAINENLSPKGRAIFITPASLTKNVKKEEIKHKMHMDPKRVTVMSYEKALKLKDKLLENPHDMIVLDEAQKLRNEDTKLVEGLQPVLDRAKHLLLLSGSPLYNDAKDIASLVNRAAGKQVLPGNKRDFDKEFVTEKSINPGLLKRLLFKVKPGTSRDLKNTKKLKEIFNQYIDYYEPEGEAKAFYPKTKEEHVEVNMSKEQERIYKFLEGKLPPHLKWKVRMGLPPSKTELQQLNSFASGLRQVANTHGPFKKLKADDQAISPKIERMVSDLLQMKNSDKNFRGVIYSNYLAGGLHPMSAALSKAGVRHGLYTGELSARDKAKMVDDYNKGKLDTLLLSSSGGEGLDLLGTKSMQIMEPHFNQSKIKQVVGRGSRYKSHMHLPPEERNVIVRHYISTRKQGPLDKFLRVKSKSIDEYLRDYSGDKEKLNEQIRELIKQQPKQQKK